MNSIIIFFPFSLEKSIISSNFIAVILLFKDLRLIQSEIDVVNTMANNGAQFLNIVQCL